MSIPARERLVHDGHDYLTDGYPLERYFKYMASKPAAFTPIWPSCTNGYMARWSVENDVLLLTAIVREGDWLQTVFPGKTGPIPATWFTGIIHAWRGERRTTGAPYQPFNDDELILKVEGGKVVREWLLDLRAIPDQTDEEIIATCPAFLLPERLRDRI
jgi:hypothetical protein